MNSPVIVRVAGPLVAVSVLLFGLGVTAAWNVQKQQQTNSALIAREVNGIVATEDLFIAMREIRRELDLFLRTRQPQHLDHVERLLIESTPLLQEAMRLARTPEEQSLIGVVSRGCDEFTRDFHRLAEQPWTPAIEREISHLNDDVLTNEILAPARKCVSFNRQVVEKTNEASRLTAQHMRLGFLLLGICGSIAGVLTGLGIARAVSRSMVQLSVSVRGVAGKLNEVSGPVTISHIGDLQGLEFGLKNLEHQISQVVERLQQRETELLRCEQLASVGQLAAGLAHELRNPLMPMKMLVQTAMERGDEGQLAGRKLQVMYDEICRLEQSIQTFLDFARPPELKVAAVDIAGVIDDTIDLVASRARQQDVEIRCVIPPERVIAQVDRDQLRQVLLNLVLNALDELSMGGLIEVQLRPTGCEEGNFEIRLSDTGGGIRPEVLGRLFQPFATTKETGMGLGLSMCQRIIASHRGTIAIHNRPQGGAEVVIRLPIGAAANALANSPFAVAT